jgi:hypothetical protein
MEGRKKQLTLEVPGFGAGHFESESSKNELAKPIMPEDGGWTEERLK